MFRLAHEVGGDDHRIGGGIGDDQRLTRAGGKIDADIAVDSELGRGDPRVAGADNLLNGADCLGSVGEGSDRLGSSGDVDLINAQKRGGRQHRL